MYSNTDVLVTEISKGHICITNSEGYTLNSTFLVTNAITLEITDAYHLWRLLKGHVEAEILRRKCALQLLQNRDFRKTAMQNHPQRRANRDTASRLFATTKSEGLNNVFTRLTGQKASHLFPTTNPWECWEDPYCDKWGCLNKKAHGDLCSIFLSSQPRTGTHRGIRGTTSVGTPLATRHPKNNQERAPDNSDIHVGFVRSQARRELARKFTEASNVGTPSATPRVTVNKRDSSGTLIINTNATKQMRQTQIRPPKGIRETQMRQTHTREQGHRNGIK